METLFKS